MLILHSGSKDLELPFPYPLGPNEDPTYNGPFRSVKYRDSLRQTGQSVEHMSDDRVYDLWVVVAEESQRGGFNSLRAVLLLSAT